MISRVLAHYPHAYLNCIALLLFLGVYLGAVYLAVRKGAAQAREAASRLPLELDGKEGHHE